MSKIKGETPNNEEVWTDRGELRNPTDRSDQPGQLAPERDEANRVEAGRVEAGRVEASAEAEREEHASRNAEGGQA